MANQALMANAIRALAMDAVQQANSGHPGAPMGMADMAAALWGEHLKHNPANPHWADRDRFVLSNGHASMLIYALLHLTGYDLPMDQLKAFRQLHSQTPGHPEVDVTPGVETTTGPLGQGDVFLPGFPFAAADAAAFSASPHWARLWLVPNAPHHPGGDFGIDAQGLATRAAADKLTWASVGLFKPGLFTDVAPGTRLALRPKLEAALDAGRLAACRWDGPWTDVGTVERLNALNAPA